MLYPCDTFTQHLEPQEIRGELPYSGCEGRLTNDRDEFHELTGIIRQGNLYPPPTFAGYARGRSAWVKTPDVILD